MTRPRVVTLCLALALSGGVRAGSLDPRCPFAEAREDTTALILWVGEARTTVGPKGASVLGPVRAVARLRRGKLEAYAGETLRDGMRAWRVLDPSDSPLTLSSISSMLDPHGEERCVYAADARPAPPKGALLATARMPGAFRAPSAQDLALFRAQATAAELLAISDLDGDGELEYWAAEPSGARPTGVSVWRRSIEGLEVVIPACMGRCSD